MPNSTTRVMPPETGEWHPSETRSVVVMTKPAGARDPRRGTVRGRTGVGDLGCREKTISARDVVTSLLNPAAADHVNQVRPRVRIQVLVRAARPLDAKGEADPLAHSLARLRHAVRVVQLRRIVHHEQAARFQIDVRRTTPFGLAQGIVSASRTTRRLLLA